MKRENDKLMPIGMIEKDIFSKRMRQTAAAGFGRKNEKLEGKQNSKNAA